MAAGLHLNVFDYEGADALRSEARELARSAAFAPPLISSNIDALLAYARCHDPGPAEQLLTQTMADAVATGGWHQWLWQMRLTQVRAELALARGAIDEAIVAAGEAIDSSHAWRRPKYEALGFMTRARSLHARGQTRSAIEDARRALQIATAIADPALLLLALDVMIELDGTDELAAQARVTADRIRDRLPDDSMRAHFDASDVVQRIANRR
jgi:hypothetical protein